MLSYRVMPSVLATRYVLQVTLRGKRLEVRSLESKLTVDGSCDGICEFILCGQLDDYCSIVAFRRYLAAVFSSDQLDVRLNEVSLHPHRSFNSPIRTIQNSRMPTLYYLVSGRESKALAGKCQNQGATERCARADRVILLDSNSEMALECKDVQCGTVRKGPDTEAILPPIRR